jgi:type IV pilus assembly protein PilM
MEFASLLNHVKSLLQEPPPRVAFEISETGIAMARVGQHAEMEFQALKEGTLEISPLKDNVIDADDFAGAVKSLAGPQAARKHKDIALILPDYSTRLAVLDFDHFPSDPKEQISLIRFRLKRSVPFDVESAALSYFVQPAAHKKIDVVVAAAPLEIVARYEAPFRAAGMKPGFVTTSAMASLELAPDAGLSVVAKIAGSVLTVPVCEKGRLRLVRCLEVAGNTFEDIAAVLLPTFVYVEDNLGGRPEKLILCGFGSHTEDAAQRFREELGVEVEPLRSPLGIPGEHNAGLLGYLRSAARN